MKATIIKHKIRLFLLSVFSKQVLITRRNSMSWNIWTRKNRFCKWEIAEVLKGKSQEKAVRHVLGVYKGYYIWNRGTITFKSLWNRFLSWLLSPVVKLKMKRKLKKRINEKAR